MGNNHIILGGFFGLGIAAPPTPAALAGVFIFVFAGALCLGIGALFFHQGFAIGDWDLVIIGVNFRKRQKPVPITAVIDKGRLQRRLDPRYFCKIDVASQLAFVFRFKVELFNLVSVHHHNARFLGVGGIDKHFLSHVFRLHDVADRRHNRRGPARS